MAVACIDCGPHRAAAVSLLLFTHVLLNRVHYALSDRRLDCPSIDSIRLQDSSKDVWVEGGIINAYEGKEAELLVFGYGLTNNTRIALTTESRSGSGQCTLGVLSSEYVLTSVFANGDRNALAGRLTLNVPSKPNGKNFFYLCVADSSLNCTELVHQGNYTYLTLAPIAKMIPLWLQVICLIFLLSLSALFSGLNLGLMSLDLTELKIIQSCGTDSEKKYAKAIAPVRKRGNYLLCTLLLGNVLVNSTIAIFLDELGGGIVAVVGSTLCIVTFGEIIPQALCSRHGLAVGARTILITKFFMILTFPLSFPLSKILDLILGQEFGQVYNREKLQELVKLADKQDIKKEEINIIQGALQLTKKTAADVMTPIDDVFMIEHHAVLDYNTMSEIMNNGYTRIPVYDGERTNIVALLNVKDLAFVDPDDRMGVKTVCKFYNRPVHFVFDDTRLDLLLEEFKKGHSHMAFVQKVVTENDKDPYYQTLGLVTLEDIIEEIIQSEILDETDVVTDNRSKRRRHNPRRKDYAIFNPPADSSNRAVLPPQLALATLQFLSTSVEPFKEEFMSTNVLKKLIKQDIFVMHKFEELSIDNLIYIAGKPVDYFVMILQGRCLVEVGKDSMTFDSGPFTYFGCQALLAGGKENVTRASALCLTDLSYTKYHTYVPDYTVKAVEDLQYIRIKRGQYIAAVHATLMEREPKTPREPGALASSTRESPTSVGGNTALLACPPLQLTDSGSEKHSDTEEDDAFGIEWDRANHVECEDGKDSGSGGGRGGGGGGGGGACGGSSGRLQRRRFYSHRNYSSGNLMDARARPSASFVTALDNFPLVPSRQVTFPRRPSPLSKDCAPLAASPVGERARTNSDCGQSAREPVVSTAPSGPEEAPSSESDSSPLLEVGPVCILSSSSKATHLPSPTSVLSPPNGNVDGYAADAVV